MSGQAGLGESAAYKSLADLFWVSYVGEIRFGVDRVYRRPRVPHPQPILYRLDLVDWRMPTHYCLAGLVLVGVLMSLDLGCIVWCLGVPQAAPSLDRIFQSWEDCGASRHL